MIVGGIWKHLTLQTNDSESDSISLVLLTLQKKYFQKIFVLGDFNINLLKFKPSDFVDNFNDTFSSNILFTHVPVPSIISKTFTY